jgi:ATP-binding cassette subfamily B (MDR/TAP) protein 1
VEPEFDQIPDTSNEMINQDSKSPYIYQNEKSAPMVGFFDLFRFAKKIDYLIMAFGTVMALGNGASMPLFALLWGNMLDSFKSPDDMAS